MVTKIKDALDLGLEIRREIRYYAVHPNGYDIELLQDWETQSITEIADKYYQEKETSE